MSTQITNREDILAFLFAGNATFTLQSGKTSDHMTYKVRKSRWAPDEYWVHAKNLPAPNVVGFLQKSPDNKFTFALNPKRRDDKYRLAFHWFINHINDAQLKFFHEGRCGKCGKPLTDPESIKRGIGPECAKSMAKTTRMDDIFAEHAAKTASVFARS